MKHLAEGYFLTLIAFISAQRGKSIIYRNIGGTYHFLCKIVPDHNVPVMMGILLHWYFPSSLLLPTQKGCCTHSSTLARCIFIQLLLFFVGGGGGGSFNDVKAGLYFDPQLLMMQIEIWIQQVAVVFGRLQ